MRMCDPDKQYEVGHEYVDLGLSVKWAICNVGADSPFEYGGRYAWGETDSIDEKGWGEKWRVPTVSDFRELIDNCKFQWIGEGDLQGLLFTSTKRGFEDRSLFLRASGLYEMDDDGIYEYGLYWTANLNTEDTFPPLLPMIMMFEKGLSGKGDVSIVSHRRELWASIRLVY